MNFTISNEDFHRLEIEVSEIQELLLLVKRIEEDILKQIGINKEISYTDALRSVINHYLLVIEGLIGKEEIDAISKNITTDCVK